jgi:hypothetical protein
MKLLKNPKLLVIGHGRHGKDEVGKLLCQMQPELTFTSSSWFFAEKMFRDFYPRYITVQECYDDRVNNRVLWRDEIAKYNYPDAAQLAKDILDVSDIYIGMRTLREFNAARPLFDFIFYVDASKRVDYVDETFEIPYDNQMIKIDNNSSLEDLKHQVKIASEIVKGDTNLLCL